MSQMTQMSQMGYGDMSGTSGFDNMIPPYDQSMNYYQEYCRLFIANVVLTTQIKELFDEKKELKTRLSDTEKRSERIGKEHRDISEPGTEKKSRMRRKANEIERHYKCPDKTCQKSYGGEGALLQHIRLKHPDITQDPDWKAKVLPNEQSEGSQRE